MGGVLLLAGFLLCGCVAAERLFGGLRAMTRVWLGLVLGLVMMMWLPSLWAFALRFSLAAQLLGLLTAGLIAFACVFFIKRKPEWSKMRLDHSQPGPVLCAVLVVPLLIVSVYLFHTHILRPGENGLYVGQSTYGDLCLHLGIASGLQNASYPPEYTLLPGTMLGYPFLSDALSASMMMLGTPMRWAFLLPSILMIGLVYLGFVMLAWEMVGDKRAVALAFFLVFLNGGLGFVYAMDKMGADPSRFFEIFTGYYQAPANLVDENVRWSNLIVDLLIPQHTFLAGWTVVIPALYLLLRAMKSKRWQDFAVLGVLAGCIPMIHTHSFLALGLISLGAMAFMLLKQKGGERRQCLYNFLLYGGVAVILAAPQLLMWSVPQTVNGGSLRFQFNWVNWENGGLIDGYFWFWIKNVGLVYLLLLPAGLLSRGRQKAMACGALVIYVVAEFILFQPNEYDNNKLFYVAFMVMMPLVAQYVMKVFDRLKDLRGTRALLAVFIGVSVLSGTLSIGREWISNYQLFSTAEVEASEFIKNETSQDAVFVTADNHNNVPAALAGRKLVCGTPLYLFFHGVDYADQAAAVQQILEFPEDSQELMLRYGVDYIYLSAYEYGDYMVDEEYIRAHWPVAFENSAVTIFAVSETAQSRLNLS